MFLERCLIVLPSGIITGLRVVAVRIPWGIGMPVRQLAGVFSGMVSHRLESDILVYRVCEELHFVEVVNEHLATSGDHHRIRLQSVTRNDRARILWEEVSQFVSG